MDRLIVLRHGWPCVTRADSDLPPVGCRPFFGRRLL